MKLIIRLLLVLGVVFLLSFTFGLQKEVARLTSVNVELRAKNGFLSEKIAQAPTTKPAKVIGEAPDGKGLQATGDSPAIASTAISAELQALLAKQLDDELKDPPTILLQKRANQKTVQRNFRYVFDNLSSIDDATLAQLKNLLVERESMGGDIRKQALLNNIVPNGEAFEKFKSEMLQPENAKIKELLGASAEEFFELDRLSPAISMYELAIKGNFEFADVPLSKEAELQLARAMTELNMGMNNPKYPKLVHEPVDPATGMIPVFASLLMRAQEFLNPTQLKILRAYENEVRANLGL